MAQIKIFGEGGPGQVTSDAHSEIGYKTFIVKEPSKPNHLGMSALDMAPIIVQDSVYAELNPEPPEQMETQPLDHDYGEADVARIHPDRIVYKPDDQSRMAI